jgi:hypothetical protein
MPSSIAYICSMCYTVFLYCGENRMIIYIEVIHLGSCLMLKLSLHFVHEPLL